jgi:FixJ family two-component response regulator
MPQQTYLDPIQHGRIVVANVGRVRVVYIVDNDASVRRSLSRLMRANGFEARCFASPQQFLDEVTSGHYGCVVLDMTASATMGTQFQARLEEMNIDMPIIATSARDDPAAREDARRIDAKFFLSKPVDDHALLDSIAWVAETMDEQDDAKGDAND